MEIHDIKLSYWQNMSDPRVLETSYISCKQESSDPHECELDTYNCQYFR